MEDSHYRIDGLQCALWNRKNLENLRHNAIDAVHVTVAFWETPEETLHQIGHWHQLLEDHEDIIMAIKEPGDFLRAKASGRTGIILGSQNASIIGDSRKFVSIFRQLGICVMQLSYNNQSLLATGCYEDRDPGITRFGKEVIEEMNRVGMIIDMSHSSEKSTLEAIALSSRPITISHANPSFFHNTRRNKSRDVLRALGQSGGLLGLCLYSPHLKNGDACSIDAFCKMAAEAAEVVGIDHIGIGSDLVTDQPLSMLHWMRSGRWASTNTDTGGCTEDLSWPTPPPWYKDNSGLQNLAEALGGFGFREEDIQKILGDNWHNFLSQGILGMGIKHEETKRT